MNIDAPRLAPADYAEMVAGTVDLILLLGRALEMSGAVGPDTLLHLANGILEYHQERGANDARLFATRLLLESLSSGVRPAFTVIPGGKS